MSKKIKPRRRRKKRSPKAVSLTPNEEDQDTHSSGGLKIVAILFGAVGGIGGAIDGYGEGGLPVALICMPITAVFAAIAGVVAVYLRGIIALFLFPLSVILIIGVMAYDLIWGLPD